MSSTPSKTVTLPPVPHWRTRTPLELASIAAMTGAARLLLTGPRIAGRAVTCEGRLPRVVRGGDIRLGRVALRGIPVAVELGATRGGLLEIGDGVYINGGSTIVAATHITLGESARVGEFVAVFDTDHHPTDEGRPTRTAPVHIGRNAWLARGSTVLPGVTVGDHAIVAAGAVVTADVPDRTVVAGNPARAVRTVTASDGWSRP
jgi:acetyltransferase-like isoleucine patch superfamily enzyme